MKVKLNNGNQPPQNKILITVLITIILPYSPIKNKAKPIAEYSVLKPETNSPSASGKSKGCLLHSANNAIKKRWILYRHSFPSFIIQAKS